MKKTLFLLVSMLLLLGLLSACGAESSKSSASGPQNMVAKKCGSCHGVIAPNLEQGKFSKSQILTIMKKGKGDKMPGGIISGNDAEKVADFLSKK
jgi:mono/diheme cytochrome c family protein